MNNEVQKILGERLKKLPEALQKAILSVDMREKLGSITKKHALHIDKAGKLEDEVVLVMLGLEPSDEFTENVVREVGLSQESATSLAGDVNREIFLPIRDALQTLRERELEEENERGEAQQALQERRLEKTRKSLESPMDEPVSVHLSEEPTEKEEQKHTESIAQQKLQQDVHMPNETESVVSPPTERKSAESARGYRQDPYRETVDSKDLEGKG